MDGPVDAVCSFPAHNVLAIDLPREELLAQLEPKDLGAPMNASFLAWVAGRWEMAAVVPIHRLRGSVLGLAGFGRIPQLVAPKAKSFGLRVVAHDPYVPTEIFTRAGVESVEFPQLLKMSDYVSVHTPLLPETRGLFAADAFRQMKPTAYLINTARGPIVDEAALARALDAGHLAGAALDVMTQEPPVSSPLVGRDNVILTPHTSFYSEESLVDLQVKAAEEVVCVLTGRAPRIVAMGVLRAVRHRLVLADAVLLGAHAPVHARTRRPAVLRRALRLPARRHPAAVWPRPVVLRHRAAAAERHRQHHRAEYGTPHVTSSLGRRYSFCFRVSIRRWSPCSLC